MCSYKSGKTKRSRTWTRIKAIITECQERLKMCTCLAALTPSLKTRIATTTASSMNKKTKVKKFF